MAVRPVDANALVVYLYKETEECIAMEDHVPEQFKEYYRGKMEAFIEVAAHVKRHTPTLDYVLDLEGEWIHDVNNLYGCSVCLKRETMSPQRMKKYCSFCGARMYKKTEERK